MRQRGLHLSDRRLFDSEKRHSLFLEREVFCLARLVTLKLRQGGSVANGVTKLDPDD